MDPYQQLLIQRLEDAPCQAARFATSKYMYSSWGSGTVSTMLLLHQLCWEPLQYQRAQNRVIMFYRIYHHIVEVSVHHLLLVTNSRAHGYVKNRICQISTMQSRHLRILIPATIIVALNNIPATIRYLPSVDDCRHDIHTISVSEIFHY